MELNKIYQGDCLEGMKTLPDNSVDCCVTDPPYGYRFMGKKWDYEIPKVEVWKEVLRVLKPGAHILVACGTRTQHRMAVNIEDSGFEIRDVISWIYGSGFPKSVNLGEGRGTALKPAQELWTLARKPTAEKTIAGNVLEYGTGGLNIDACRIETEDNTGRLGGKDSGTWSGKKQIVSISHNQGRFPSNVIFDEEAAALLDERAGIRTSGGGRKGEEGKRNYLDNAESNSLSGARSNRGEIFIDPIRGAYTLGKVHADSGGASRFFYCAKADPSERNSGTEGLSKEIEHSYADECATCGGRIHQNANRPSACKCENPVRKGKTIKGNFHPTVKPLALMQYLIRLICPPLQGIVLEPFAGSGTTCIAARKEDKNFIAFELNPEYIEIANRRLKSELGLFI